MTSPVRESRSISQAYKSLTLAQKGNRGAPAYSRWVNRPAGRVLAATAYRLGMTPNQVTAVSAVITYTAIALVASVTPSTSWSVTIAALLLLGYALDSADGQLARLTERGRPSGEWLDHVVDMCKLCLLHGAVAISWVRWGTSGVDSSAWAVGVPVLFLTVSVVSFFGWLLSDLLIRIAQAKQIVPTVAITTPDSAAAQAAPALRSLLRLPSDYGLLALTFAWFAAPLFAASYALLMAANAVILGVALPVWFRQVRASEEAT